MMPNKLYSHEHHYS